MRLSVILLIVALAGILGGAVAIGAGLPAVGGVVIFDGLLLAGWALFRDDGTGPARQQPAGALTLAQILERARAS